MTRANPMIWRVAKWLYDNLYTGLYDDQPFVSYYHCYTRDRYYDKAAELLKKISLNEFTTGEDNHGD